MKILVVNDDGIDAIGLKLLVEYIYPFNHELLVVAPLCEQSGVGHAISIKRLIKLEKRKDIMSGIPTYAFDGTPADCVKFALSYLDYKADLVISGSNNGYNIGDYIIYSGTAAGAREAALNGIKAIAVSCNINCHTDVKHFPEVMKYLINNKMLDNAPIINVNIPPNPVGIKLTHQGRVAKKGYFEETFVDGKLFFIPREKDKIAINDDDTDIEAINNHFISISYLTYDQTYIKR